MEFIDSFLQSINIGGANKAGGSTGSTKTSPKRRSPDKVQQDRLEFAKEIAKKAIIEAEKCKAVVQQPEGKCCSGHMVGSKLRLEDSNDDDFFYIICHIDPVLIAKIEKGEYIELEKLLQKPEHLRMEDENKQILVNRDSQQFWIPFKDKENKTTGIRKWDQAFRVYATIYCKANPHRSLEIWQYVDTINNAAQKFSWEKVPKYDYVFRHLMHKKPNRSWAKTYMQMWAVELSGSDQNKRFESESRFGNTH